MREFVKAIQEVDLCLTKPSLKDTGGQVCKRKHRNMLRSVTNAKNLHQTFTNREESSTLCPALGHLLNKAWILQVLSLEQQGIRGIYSSAQITSPSGLKLNCWPTSGMQMLKDLFGKILLLDLVSFTPSSQITACSLIARPSGGTIVTWRLPIDISPRLTPKIMDRPRPSIKSQ